MSYDNRDCGGGFCFVLPNLWDKFLKLMIKEIKYQNLSIIYVW